jgi:citrate synthase
MADEQWGTAITRIEPNKILLRGYRVDKLMGEKSFAEVVYLAVKGELPDTKVARLMNAILVSSVDHGVTPPSAQTAIMVASTGASVTTSLAAGVSAIQKFHGGAIEDCMRVLYQAVEKAEEEGKAFGDYAKELLKISKEQKRRIPGFGHRIHTEDPRSMKLFAMAEETGIDDRHIRMAKALEDATEEIIGKRLPLNVDGAIAAVLCCLGFAPELGNAFFAISRMPGLVAHVEEEKRRYRPMRRILADKHFYDGPDEREL